MLTTRSETIETAYCAEYKTEIFYKCEICSTQIENQKL